MRSRVSLSIGFRVNRLSFGSTGFTWKSESIRRRQLATSAKSSHLFRLHRSPQISRRRFQMLIPIVDRCCARIVVLMLPFMVCQGLVVPKKGNRSQKASFSQLSLPTLLEKRHNCCTKLSCSCWKGKTRMVERVTLCHPCDAWQKHGLLSCPNQPGRCCNIVACDLSQINRPPVSGCVRVRPTCLRTAPCRN